MGTYRTAGDIMHPRTSLQAEDTGEDIVKKLLSQYPALPVADDKLDVIGIVSGYDILGAPAEGRPIHELNAESIMSCGHAAHTDETCKTPVTVTAAESVQKVVDICIKQNVTVLPVIDKKSL